MDMKKTGELLRSLRQEKGLTQKQAAEILQVSDRTVSKWERSAGLPDVSLLRDISALYDVDIEWILEGKLGEEGANAGKRKRMEFFRCGHCGNVFWSSGGGEISCCGRKLSALQAQPEGHEIQVEEMEGEYFISFGHEMKKEHYIAFAALVSWDRVTLVQLYPEQAAEVRLPQQRRGELYFYCSEHGLFRKKI